MSRTIRNLHKKHQVGASMLEMLGVILVIAFILAGGAYAMNKLTSTGSVSDDSKNIQLLIANTRAGKDITGYAAGDLLPGLVSGGDVPKNMSITGNTVANSWGGSVTVTGAGQSFTVTNAAIAQSDCVKEAMAVSRVATSTAINGGTAVTGPMTKVQATAGCTTSSNTLSFISN